MTATRRSSPDQSEPSPLPPFESIATLARRFGITARTIRWYESAGILSASRRGAIRVFSQTEIRRLESALRARRLGFSLAEIREYLGTDATAGPGESERRESTLRAAIQRLTALRADLDAAIRELNERLDGVTAAGAAGAGLTPRKPGAGRRPSTDDHVGKPTRRTP